MALDLRWHVKYNTNTGTYYAKATRRVDDVSDKKKKSVYLNIEIMNPERNGEVIYVDHRNHDTLDNRKENLRITNNPNNSAHRKSANKNGSTGVRNVNRSHNENILWVQFMKDGKRYKWEFPIEQFDEAVKFAEQKRKELFGEYAGEG